MTIKSMNDLFLHTLKDIYYAEKQIYKNLPKMAKSAESPDLKRAFEKHREETEHHIERLETIFDQCGVAPRAIRCDAMDGILAEAKDVMEEIEDGQVHDAGMLAAAPSATPCSSWLILLNEGRGDIAVMLAEPWLQDAPRMTTLVRRRAGLRALCNAARGLPG